MAAHNEAPIPAAAPNEDDVDILAEALGENLAINEGNEGRAHCANNGCDAIFANEEEQQLHEDICQYEDTLCVFKYRKCLPMPYNTLIEHIENRHMQFLNNREACNKIRNRNTKSGEMYSSFYNFNEKHFMFRMKIVKGRRYPHVFILTKQVELQDRYRYEIKMRCVDNNVPYRCRNNCTLYTPNAVCLINEPLPTEFVVNNQLLNYRLKVTIFIRDEVNIQV